MPKRTTLPVLLLLLFCRATQLEAASTAAVDCGPQAALSNCINPVRTEDSVWVISTRHLGCPSSCEGPAPNFQVQRYDGATGWAEASLEQLLADGASPRPTVIYVHGNREDAAMPRRRGLTAYRSLIEARKDPPPLRFLIWSWPAEPIRGPRRDALAKAVRSDCEAYYLGQFLAASNPQARVGLFGFSYGARIITGALHLLGGGTLVGLKLPEGTATGEHHARVVLMAAALHNYWLLPDNAHGKCWSQIDRLLVQFNPCDRLLRFYPLLDRCTRPQALGYTGFLWSGQLADDASRLEQQNVCCEIGHEHFGPTYIESPAIMAQVERFLLGPDARKEGILP